MRSLWSRPLTETAAVLHVRLPAANPQAAVQRILVMVTGRLRLHVVLVDVPPEHRRALRQACVDVGYQPISRTVPHTSTDELGQWADLVVVGADLGLRALHTAERARQAGVLAVGLLINWWSDLEWDAREVADFVLHVPLASDELHDVLSSVPALASPWASGQPLGSESEPEEAVSASYSHPSRQGERRHAARRRWAADGVAMRGGTRTGEPPR